jgi:hypothetical protein
MNALSRISPSMTRCAAGSGRPAISTCPHRADPRSSGTRLINHLGGEPIGESGCTLRLPGLVFEISTRPDLAARAYRDGNTP